MHRQNLKPLAQIFRWGLIFPTIILTLFILIKISLFIGKNTGIWWELIMSGLMPTSMWIAVYLAPKYKFSVAIIIYILELLIGFSYCFPVHYPDWHHLHGEPTYLSFWLISGIGIINLMVVKYVLIKIFWNKSQ